MKQVIVLAKFEEWRVLARQYPELDQLIRFNFLDSVQYLELQIKHRTPIIISKIEILGCSYTKWFIDLKTYYIYHHYIKPTGVSTSAGTVVSNNPEKAPGVVKITHKKPRKLIK